jgi:tetratricopeptide (TPR) repeat protein
MSDGDDAFERLLRELARAPDCPPQVDGRPVEGSGPATLLHYRILGKIGEGGMGAVYKAEDTKLGRVVAIKLVASHASGDEASRLRLLREARAASALSHPCVVTIFAIEEAEELDFLVMEYVDGEPLDAVIARGPLDPDRAANLAADVADALEHAHVAGLVHRDVKPANIIVTTRGRAKVLDFGIAKPHTHAEGSAVDSPTAIPPLTASGAIVGTGPYMSPEQLRGGALDGRSDVFALGAVLYEMLTARRAFPGGNLAALVEQVTRLDPPRPSALAPRVPAELDAIVLRALAKDRERRFASANEMAAALHATFPGSKSAFETTSSRRAEEGAIVVGRDAEIARLLALVERASRGAGALAVVVAEAGMGKSAVVGALVQRSLAIAPALFVARGRGVEQLGPGEAYLPLLEALEDLLHGAHPDIVREVLVAAAPTWAVQLRFARSSAASALERESLGATRERMLREMGDAIAALAERAPLLLVIEDAHWADPSTVEALRHLASRIDRQRVLLVATMREEEARAAPIYRTMAEWRARGSIDEVRLSELGEAEVARWIDTRFAPNDFDAALARAIRARTEGHALFVAATLDWLVARGRIARDARGWHTDVGDPTAVGVPDALRDLLRARLEALAPDDARALAYASVQGLEVDALVLASVLEADPVAVDEQLAGIARVAHLLRRAADVEHPDGSLATRWRFAHALYRDVLYEDLAVQRKAQLHRHTGEALAVRQAGDTRRVAAELALHFELGRDFPSAARHLSQAGENAMSLFANVEAERYFTRALACAERCGTADRAANEVAIRRQRAVALTAMSRYDAAIDDLERALEVARGSGVAELEGATHVALADARITAHRLEEAAPHVEAALAIAARESLGALREDALAMRALERLVVGALDECEAALDALAAPTPLAIHLRGLLFYFRSAYASAERAFAEAAERNERMLADGLLLMESRMFGALAVANLGRLGEALARLEAALDLARRNDNAAMQARVENSLGWVRRELGMTDRAVEHDARASEVGRSSEESEAEANALLNLAEDRLASGAPVDAAATFGRVEDLASADAWLRWRYLLRLDAARARERLASGAPGDAITAARTLGDRAAEQGAPKYVAIACEVEARAWLAAGDVAAARAGVDRARATLASAPCPLVSWRVELLAGEVAARAGDASGARDAGERAGRLIEGIATGLPPQERVSFLALTTKIATANGD